jgi:hypothetical protein
MAYGVIWGVLGSKWWGRVKEVGWSRPGMGVGFYSEAVGCERVAC